MYPVSNDYLTAISKNARAHRLSGVVGANHSFDGDDVVRNSFVVKNQLCPATEIALGGVYIGELDLTFSTEFATSLNLRGNWRGVTITAELGVEIGEDTWEDIPIPGGTYTIDEAKWTNDGLQVVAYDNMSKFDKPFSMTQSSGTVYDFLSLACLACGVTLGMTAIECDTLPNGTMIMGLYPDDSIETYRDMIAKLATACCCFATIDRLGKLVLRRFPDSDNVALTIPAKLRYSTTFSDWTSYYDTVTVVNMADDTLTAYYNDNVNGLTMNIGSNPFLQYGTDETVTQMRQTIADALYEFETTPFSVSLLPNPALDLGDLIQFSGGYAQNSIGMIMSFTMRVDSTSIEGYGENPALADARSKVDKEISGLIGKTEENEVIIHTFVNAQEFELEEEEETEVIRIHFATVNPKIVQILHELKLDVTSTSEDGIVTCTVHYYLNDEEISYHPVTTWDNDGLHLLHLMYFLSTLEPGERYDWSVALEMSGGTATIDREWLRAALFGQGLVAVSTWDGLIEITDDTYHLGLHGHMSFNYDDSAEVTTFDYSADWSEEGKHHALEIADQYALSLKGHMQFNFEDGDVFVNTYAPVDQYITEGEDDFITEDGDMLVTEGD